MKKEDILREQTGLINPDEYIIKRIDELSIIVSKELAVKLKQKKIKADVFVGGSVGKGTIIKREKYDIDIFVRFDNSYNTKKISDILQGIVGKKARRIHGSRDYYQISDYEKENIIIEIIPVIKIKNPEQAHNITDLSYFHVNYVTKRIKKNKKLKDEIKLAKSFSYFQGCYGAESYINGFSGYALELLIIHYGSFLNFIKAIAKFPDKKKIIIDSEKFYKNKQEVIKKLNISKTKSPIILIDPTYKERNALAGLNHETYIKFKNACKKFLKKPDENFFEKRNIRDKFKKDKNVKIISIKTTKQTGDIAGTKSKKFFNFFVNTLNKSFDVKKSDYEYVEEKNLAYYYFVIKKKKDSIKKGPNIDSIKNFNNFKKHHRNYFVKSNIAYAKIKHPQNFEDFFKNFVKNNKRIIKDMSIKEIKIVR